MFDEATGLNSSDLHHNEIELLRPQVYKYLSETSGELLFHKIHDAWRILPDGQPLVPTGITRAALYFIRNPLDVAISFAHHSAISIDKVIEIMNDGSYAFCSREDRLHNQMRQQLLTWSGHVESWVDKSGLPVMVIKYEDMLADTFNVFKRTIDFAGITADDEKIKKALHYSSFENLKKQENEKGFREKVTKSESFFRKGVAGDWKTVLSGSQVQRILRDHGSMMARFGYSDR